MPHCIIEHSTDFDSDQLVSEVFTAALHSGLFDPDGNDIKVRALSFSSYLTGPRKSPFIHVALKILSGRTPEQRSNLSSTVVAQLRALGFSNTSITAEVVEMERGSYGKVIV
ncbi:5-carboxymethyl-2-hydroxymuconate isomerase [Parazoarcus communis]|uniref:5-carboxymethyl-2-hydroxymuconate isomerase n=1 Tax=Parazoarcus communis TaxID=41977 RepID=A0A2U8H0U7_9RHOO|nr:5-carboxymethyl-2-hydroxymuconate Delta-isomerase [Parazoarcus communis]AWI79288.1 5-carboxymethyl-2-hydroxymuconate isomerase [Parazoarcus communis]